MDLSSLVSAAMSWSGGQKYLALMLLLVCMALAMALSSKIQELRIEEAEHNATLTRLELSEANCASLTTALEAAHNATESMQDNIRAALQREAQARADTVSRKQIMQGVKAHLRTEQGAKEVIDDAARNAVADRLNRPL